MKKLLSAILFFSLAGFVTALPCFAQQSANVNSTWNGGMGPLFSADTLTIGDITAPVVAPAEVTVNQGSTLTVEPGQHAQSQYCRREWHVPLIASVR